MDGWMNGWLKKISDLKSLSLRRSLAPSPGSTSVVAALLYSQCASKFVAVVVLQCCASYYCNIRWFLTI